MRGLMCSGNCKRCRIIAEGPILLHNILFWPIAKPFLDYFIMSCKQLKRRNSKECILT